jgi:hypothetical protein
LDKGVGRNLSSPLTQIVETGSPGAGGDILTLIAYTSIHQKIMDLNFVIPLGDYHTTYYPAPIFLSTWNYVVSGEQKRFSDC